MSDGLKRVLWTGLQAFLASLAITAPGVLTSPNLSEARALGVSALVAALAAALSAIKNALVPPEIR